MRCSVKLEFTDDVLPLVKLNRLGQLRDQAAEGAFRQASCQATTRDARLAFNFGALASLVLLVGEVIHQHVGPGYIVAFQGLALFVCLAAAVTIARVAYKLSYLVIIAWQFAFTVTLIPMVMSGSDMALTVVLLLPILLYLTAPINVGTSIASGVLSSVALLASYFSPGASFVDVISLAMVLAGVNAAVSMVVIRIGRHRRIAFIAARRFEQSSAQLAASQALLERTFSAVRLPLLVTDAQTGLIIRTNRAAEYFLSNALGRLAGRSAVEFYPDPMERLAFAETLQKQGSVSAFPACLRRHDGEVRSVLLSAEKVAGTFAADADESSDPSEHLVTSIIDRTEDEAREKRIRESESEYRALFENSVIGIYRSTPDGRMLRGNPALVALNGYDAETDLVALVNDIAQEWYVEPDRRDEFKRRMATDGAVSDFVSEIYRHKTRERIWVSESAWCIRNAEGEMIAYEGTVLEVTERKRQEALNAELARHDPLTGLANRRLFDERLDQALASASRSGVLVAVLYLDIDRFKAINDENGHIIGDQLLVQIARGLKASCRTEDTVARYGGDEFVILQVGLAQPEGAVVLAKRILKMFDLPFEFETGSIRVGTSIGIAALPENGSTAHGLIAAADQALYRAKTNGRKRFEIAAQENRPCSTGANSMETSRDISH